MANQYLELDRERLIAFANGTSINGYTITAAASPAVIDSAPALETVTSTTNGWTLTTKVMHGSKEIYTLHHS